jgi:hypothetical protein
MTALQVPQVQIVLVLLLLQVPPVRRDLSLRLRFDLLDKVVEDPLLQPGVVFLQLLVVLLLLLDPLLVVINHRLVVTGPDLELAAVLS